MDKKELQNKTVAQLERLAKKYGAKTVKPDGKRKTKADLINGVLMAYRLKGGKGLADGGKIKHTRVSVRKNAQGGKYAVAFPASGSNRASVIYRPPGGKTRWLIGTIASVAKQVDILKEDGYVKVPYRDIKL